MAPVNRAYAQNLPKIELHAHLSGSISRQCLHDIWLQKKETHPELDLDDPLVAIPVGKVDYDINTFFPLFNSYIYRLCSDIPSIYASTLSVLEDFEKDGVVYLELRTTPRAISNYSISKRRYVETVLSAIDEYEREPAHQMRTKLILSVDRRNTIEEAHETIDLAADLHSRGVVGVDLCGNPAVAPITHLAPAFVEAKLAGLKITLHFAEVPQSASDGELEMLLKLKPDRLGHVIHVKDTFRKAIIAQGIGVEICISCNVHAKMIEGSYGDHHFGYWHQSHTRVALSTDDVGVFCSPLSEEYFLAAKYFNLDRTQLRKLSTSVIDMIFDSEEEKTRLRKLFAERTDSPTGSDDSASLPNGNT